MRRPTLSTVPATLLALLLAGTLAACGDDDGAEPEGSAAAARAADALVVEDPWVRATTGSEDPSMTAAFMVLDNDGEEELTVTGASAEVAGRTELHEMAVVDGESAMRQIEGGLVLPAGRGLLLQPGGTHVMLMDLTEELAPGDEVEVTLELSDGSEVTTTMPVKEFTEEEGHYHDHGDHDHGDHDHGDDHGGDDQ